ncbi:MAG: ATP synthase F1 subunit epsilon, partial [Staphylococcus equorum]|nr:ATP synthase F1 subunit epsilon [Staphylococcus equorum]
MKLKMLSFDGKVHSEELSRISLPTNDGIRTVLDNHMDIVVPVNIGKVKIIKGNQTKKVVVSEGIFNFKDNYAQLLVRTYEFPEEIDKERAMQAKERAEKKLENDLSSK